MITGFNTDIEYGGVTYHVQTEDKGLAKPLILSLVYTGGEILASKRSPYDDLVAAGFDEKVLTERLNRQHKLICAAIKQGRIDDLRRMTMRAAAEPAAARPPAETIPATIKEQPVKSAQIGETSNSDEPAVIQTPGDLAAEPLLEIPIEVLDEAESFPEIHLATEPARAASKQTIALPPAAAVVQPGGTVKKPLASNIAAAAPAEPAQPEVLTLRLLEEREFRGGERVELQILVARGANAAIQNAEVMVKILGSSFRPQIFHARAGRDGVAVVHLQLPHFKSGRAAILIRAENDGEVCELRRIVTQS